MNTYKKHNAVKDGDAVARSEEGGDFPFQANSGEKEGNKFHRANGAPDAPEKDGDYHHQGPPVSPDEEVVEVGIPEDLGEAHIACIDGNGGESDDEEYD